MKGFFRTQWIQSISDTVVADNASINLFTLITDVSKNANGCDTDYNALSISTDKILIPYQGKMTHNIRVSVSIITGTLQTYYVQLRRYTDNSVIATKRFQRNPDVALDTQNFTTYTGSSSDPYVTGGFYLAILNESGLPFTLTGNIDLYIETRVR